MANIKLIAGLGNPGKEYEYTRHNCGFLVAKQIAEQLKFNFELSSLTNGLTAQGQYGDQTLIVLLPLTYMNHSGVAVKDIVEKNNIDCSDILVVCDDLNLEFMQLRLRAKGSDGGNNGLASVIEKFNSEEIARLRMGIGEPRSGDAVDYVLEEFTKKEKKHLNDFVEKAAQCCLSWLDHGIERTMEQYNSKPVS